MSDSEAAGWHGREAHFDSSQARFHDDSCANAAFHSRVVRADSLLLTGFRVAPGDLGFRDEQSVTVTTISCNGADWLAPGSWMVWAAQDSAYTTWDGVFFLLVRNQN